MSSITVEGILAQVNQLPPLERKKLIVELTRFDRNGKEGAAYEVPEGRIIRTDAPCVDRTLEYEWLAKHRREHIGEWIALKGNELVANGSIAREVFSKARESGFPDAMVLFVEDPDIPFVNA
jgi:Family of unknown function (DUF5678)